MKYRKISPCIWNDEKVRGMSDRGKLALLFLLTHPHMTALGAIRANIPGLAFELGWTTEAFREAFREALAKGIAQYDEKANLIWFPKFTKHNPPESPNVVRSWAGAYEELPECDLKKTLLFHVSEYMESLPKSFREAFGEVFGKSMPNQEQEHSKSFNTLTSFECLSSPPCGDDHSELPEHAPEEKPGEKVPPCPHGDIVAAYHELLPELAGVKVWDGARKAHLQARWRERWKCGKFGTREEGIAYFRRLFEHVNARCDWLMGRISARDGKTFRADLAWMVRPENFAKIIEGKYDRREAA